MSISETIRARVAILLSRGIPPEDATRRVIYELTPSERAEWLGTSVNDMLAQRRYRLALRIRRGVATEPRFDMAEGW